jgi:hypothetical protein
MSIVGLFVTGFIGWVVDSPNNWSWDTASIPVVGLVSGACFLTSHFGRLVVRISVYLEVFHESKWESRLRDFRSSKRPLRSNQLVAGLYFGVAATATVTFVAVCEGVPTHASLGVFAILVAALLSALFELIFRSSPHDEYRQEWTSIFEKEGGA